VNTTHTSGATFAESQSNYSILAQKGDAGTGGSSTNQNDIYNAVFMTMGA
jgi:hypothetical protein